ncbi:acidic phospholipase A2 PLA-1-like [Dromiciops gliroides]|uniref:acidic phospholipase A2 PLA-1-like n=1 Tax=Dromiciops gliroides TaxID=33562 RepID=UPI001CC43B29|nr:acidic phospholipase A2 PLA-1-like [Dromiciops gliroides]
MTHKALDYLQEHLLCGGFVEIESNAYDVTGKNAFLDYAFYGCYCGCGGKGEPLDDNDRCCWAHDCCYDKLEGKCESKLQKYSYTYNAGVVTCTDSNFCKFESCTCDKLLAECLREHTSSFNPSYKGFSRSKCKEKNLPCQA